MIYFTADLHLNHTNIIKYCNRPFNDVKEMENKIFANFSVIKPNDTLYVVGDISYNVESIKRFFDVVKCKVIYVRGNHDPSISKLLNLNISDFIVRVYVANIEGYSILITHKYVEKWETIWDIHIFGHSHGNFVGTKNSFDVGVDTNNFYPYSFEDIKRKII